MIWIQIWDGVFLSPKWAGVWTDMHTFLRLNMTSNELDRRLDRHKLERRTKILELARWKFYTLYA